MIETQVLRVHITEFPVPEVLNLEQKVRKDSNDSFRPSPVERKFLTNTKISLGNEHKVTQPKADSMYRALS
jgi:hypothetical protein